MLRTRTALDLTLKPLITADWRRVTPALKDVLRIGAYQLLNVDRVPPHAAVETAVELARSRVGPGAAGMVNAVLRRVASAAASPAAETRPPAAEHSHPEWLVKRWRDRFGVPQTAALLEHNNRRPPLIIQPARWSAERIAGALEERGIAFEPVPDAPGFSVHHAKVTKLPGYPEGGFVVQDPAQARVLQFTRFPEASLVWDACAAPGGKAAVLAQRHPVVASDVRLARLQRLRETVNRVAPGLPVFAADARRPPVSPASLGAVLLDAPCSATGTLARHPDARWRLSARRIETLARLQTELLDGVAPVLRPGGVLVYATCSLEPEENEQQVNGFLARHAAYRRTDDDLFVFPPDSGTDGAYAARLERAA